MFLSEKIIQCLNQQLLRTIKIKSNEENGFGKSLDTL